MFDCHSPRAAQTSSHTTQREQHEIIDLQKQNLLAHKASDVEVGQLLLLNLFIGLQPRSGVDNLGHVGGAAAGAALGLLLAPAVDRPATAREGDGSLLPAPLTALALAVTVVVVAVALRDAAQLARYLQVAAAGRRILLR